MKFKKGGMRAILRRQAEKSEKAAEKGDAAAAAAQTKPPLSASPSDKGGKRSYSVGNRNPSILLQRTNSTNSSAVPEGQEHRVTHSSSGPFEGEGSEVFNQR